MKKLSVVGAVIGTVLLCIFVPTFSLKAALSCNGVIAFEKGTSEGYAHIVNHTRKTVQAELVLKGSNAIIYRSELIPAGGFVENIKLLVDAPQGAYECELVFKGLNDFGKVKVWDTAKVYITVEH